MRRFSARHVAVFLVLVLIGGLSLIDAGAQWRKKRPRRVSRSAAPKPTPTPGEGLDPADPRIVSTADQSNTTSKGASTRSKSSPSPTPDPESERLRQTITDLSGQINRMADKLTQMEQQQRSLVDIERLSRAEQRAETFRSQLRDVQARPDLQLQLDQSTTLCSPNKSNVSWGFGTMHRSRSRSAQKATENQRRS